MKFNEFRLSVYEEFGDRRFSAADASRVTGASKPSVYRWLKKMVDEGELLHGDREYGFPPEIPAPEVHKPVEVEVIEERMPRASMTVAAPKVEEVQESSFSAQKIADIEIPSKRLRSLNLQKVGELAQSIKTNGLINAVTVYKTENGLTLIAGLHRLEACKSLGMELINCSVHEVDVNKAELLEIDENLMRQELTVLEQSEHIQRREEILEVMGLRAKSGTNLKNLPDNSTPLFDPQSDGTGDTVTPVKTTQSIADEIGLNERSVQRRKQIATNIVPEVKESLRDTEIANSTTQLVEVARMEPEQQKEFADAVQSGEVSTVKEFKQKTEPKPVEVYIPPTVSTIPEPSFVPDINNYTARDGHIVPKSVLAEMGDESEPSLPVEEKKERNHFTSLEKSGKTDEHYTPEKITNFLYQFCPEFDLDPCSNPGKNIKAKKHYTQEDNGLEQIWEGSVFINPPFSDVETWVNKALDEYMKGNCKEVVFLSKFDGRVGWFKPLISNFSPFCIVQGYVSYYGNDGDAATFTTALWYLGERKDDFIQAFESLGWVCQVVDQNMEF